MTEPTLTIPRRYRGPATSSNGGWIAGRLAREIGGPAEVTLRLPPPVARPLVLGRDGERVLLHDGDALVAEARPADPGLVAPVAPRFDDLAGRDQPAGWLTEAFGECFSCGHRPEGDGLEIHPLPWEGGVAAPWVAREVMLETVWAAIDCSGAYAVGGLGRGAPLLARMTARVERLPREGERCVVVAWPLGEDGRKLHAGTALVGDDGATLAVSRQLWVIPRSSG
ncbi:MAG: hypothetical protein EXQ77_01850 [Thermoleophilia bacterium]|nr:hypothetical protein [Thermoleophilia bacterium]